MLPTFALVLLTAAGPAPIKLASPGLKGFNVSADATNFYSDHFAQELTQQGLQVTTASEIQSLLGLERQRQLIGCADQSGSCMAELANALGADGIIVGRIGKVGDTYQLDVKILAASDGRALTTFSATAHDDAELLSVLTTGAQQVAATLFAKLKRTPAVAPTNAVATRPVVSVPTKVWLPAAVGAALAGGGVYFLSRAYSDHQMLTASSTPPGSPNPATLRNDESLSQTLAWVGLGAGVVGLSLGGVFLGTSSSAQTRVSVLLGAGTVGVAGVFQ